MAELPNIDMVITASVNITQVIDLNPVSKYLVVIEMDETLRPEAYANLKTRLEVALRPLFDGVKFEIMITDAPLNLSCIRFKAVYDYD